jgi:murein DD-endopeptidase MepM/ murein hydrolase activator NlpD
MSEYTRPGDPAHRMRSPGARSSPLSIAETFGLTPPLARRWREVRRALLGDRETPATRFGLSSLGMMRPGLALGLWLGRSARDRRVVIYNLFNHRQPPPERGWSVERTNLEDFLGTDLTYDSHNGTDFAVPPGTVVVAAAPGRVLRVSSEFNRGGLKVFIDHGRGLITTSNHLGRSFVSAGEIVQRGQPIALSGYSGIDGLMTFPWGAPHVHFNVWLDGAYVDPFARPGERSLWRAGNLPTPHDGADGWDAFAPTEWDTDAIEEGLRACHSEEARREVRSFERDFEQAAALLFQMNYFPYRFTRRSALYAGGSARDPWLDLPFDRGAYEGVRFAHDVEPPRV